MAFICFRLITFHVGKLKIVGEAATAVRSGDNVVDVHSHCEEFPLPNVSSAYPTAVALSLPHCVSNGLSFATEGWLGLGLPVLSVEFLSLGHLHSHRGLLSTLLDELGYKLLGILF